MPRFSTGGRIRISPSAIMQLGRAPRESNARRASRAAPTFRRSSSLPTCLCLGWKREKAPQEPRNLGARRASRVALPTRHSLSPLIYLCPGWEERDLTSAAPYDRGSWCLVFPLVATHMRLPAQ
ncbi:hypothetical protein NDU88_006787 [Pleurodeles waltl]|uniref:Uncharacterized protein n=1 Tax=Pleurodeles waltl TaxID=8319 RepID=A0AAV7SQN4_PLEWA|nr:hypothetical protein NDU88_006787 [Pleurodeles waltl]